MMKPSLSRAYKLRKHRLIGDVRGSGLFIGIELVKDKKAKEPAIDEALNVFLKCA